MKKVISLLLATAMLCGAASAYDIAGGQMNAAPKTVQSDLTASLATLGLDAPKVTNESGAGFTATLGDRITLFATGTDSATRAIAARLDTTDSAAALASSQDFGAVCGAIISLVSPGTSSAVANNALKLETTTPVTAGDNLRSFYTNKALFTYEVAQDGVRFTALACPESAGSIRLLVNDAFLTLDVPPKIVNSRTLVPLRGIFEQFGAEIEWNQGAQTAIVRTDDTEVRVTIGSKTAYVNGEARTLDVAAQLVSSRTLVPVRFISEALGAAVGWNADAQIVLISAR